MNSLILCEGKTDCVLLQYYLEKVHCWERVKKHGMKLERDCWSNCFVKSTNTLNIAETKGCSRLVDGLLNAILQNENAAPGDMSDFIDRVIIFTDNDEENVPSDLIFKIKNSLSDTSAQFLSDISLGVWNTCTLNGVDGVKRFKLLLLCIPFDENGALETYLLKCIGDGDAYDKKIIDRGNSFVDTIDPESKYLQHRRQKTKAKFDVYFSVRTSVDQYGERQNILRSVPWEKYQMIRSDFKIFEELG